jgi:hypothetical protein
VAVPFPLSWKVRPPRWLESVAATTMPGIAPPAVVTVKLPAVPLVKEVELPEVMASTYTVNTWVVSVPGALLAWMVMAEPSSMGAVQDTEAAWPVTEAVTPVGASGAVDGTALFEAAEAAPTPSALLATTVKVSLSPSVRPRSVPLSPGS